MQDAHQARRAPVEILADGVLEERHVDDVLPLGDADALAKRANGLGVYPRRRIPTIVGILGSSQPLTWPSSTNSSSLRLLMSV